jgi:hypothetical protein
MCTMGVGVSEDWVDPRECLFTGGLRRRRLKSSFKVPQMISLAIKQTIFFSTSMDEFYL